MEKFNVKILKLNKLNNRNGKKVAKAFIFYMYWLTLNKFETVTVTISKCQPIWLKNRTQPRIKN